MSVATSLYSCNKLTSKDSANDIDDALRCQVSDVPEAMYIAYSSVLAPLQIAEKINQLNLTCRQEAVAVISGKTHDNQPFYDKVAMLSGAPLDALLIHLVNEDHFCHSLDKVSCRLSGRVYDSLSISSG